MADSMEQLMKAIQRAEKEYGGNHTYRHVFGALREARYAASRISGNANYESPGRQEARESAAKAHVPPAEDSRNPNVPESSPDEGGTNGGEPGSST
jgi:hypothetical protein